MNDKSITDRLRELFELYESGALSKDEYNLLKSEIISGRKVESIKEVETKELPTDNKDKENHATKVISSQSDELTNDKTKNSKRFIGTFWRKILIGTVIFVLVGISIIFFKPLISNLLDAQHPKVIVSKETTIDKIYFKDSSYYYGQIKNGEPNGNGNLIKNDKILQEGIWENGKYIGPNMSQQPEKPSTQNVNEQTIQPSTPIKSPTVPIISFQNALKSIGYNIQDRIGVFGDDTKKQLKQFQQDYSLDITGIMDKTTAKELAEALETKNVTNYEPNAKQWQKSLNSFATSTSTSSTSNSGNANTGNTPRIVSCQSISDNPQNFIGKAITVNLGYASSLNGRRSLKGGDIEEEKTFSMAVISVYEGNDEYYSRIGDCSGGTNLVLRIPHRLVVPNIISGYINVTGILKDQYTLIVKSISR